MLLPPPSLPVVPLWPQVIVFFSSCNSVKFHAELLNYIDLPVLDLHGNQKQNKRTATFFDFCKAEKGTLLCTDVAARGLDIPSVDWIVQYDPPDDPREYIHRVGRTARAGAAGRALLLLLPEELGFIKFLKQAKVGIKEYEFPLNKLANVMVGCRPCAHCLCWPLLGSSDCTLALPCPPKRPPARFCTGSTRASDREELLPAQVGARRIPLLPACVCRALAEGHLRRVQP